MNFLPGGHSNPMVARRAERPELRGLSGPHRYDATMTALPFPDVLRFEDLTDHAREPARWVWHGYLAAGAVTLLTSRWKAGKTTLLSVLLARLGAGGELAGLPVAAGRAVVVSEEAPGMW